MRALYEIDADLEALCSQVDENGELLIDQDALDSLLMERTDKIEGVCLLYKNVTAEAAAIKAEEDNLKKRREALEKKKDGLARYLERALAGERFETAKVAVGYRRSEQTEITDPDRFFRWAKRHKEFLRMKDPDADKTAIKAAIKAGEKIPGAEIVEKKTMKIN